MALISWTKPSGLEIETNDSPATVKYCESLKWKRSGVPSDDPDPAAQPPRPAARAARVPRPAGPSEEEMVAAAPVPITPDPDPGVADEPTAVDAAPAPSDGPAPEMVDAPDTQAP